MRRILLAVTLIIIAAFALVACNGAAVLNSLTPSSSFERERAVPYGDHPRQTLDLYRAESPRNGAPAVVFVHGGGWEDGNRKMYKFIGDSFAKEGFDVVVPNYRLHPEAVYPSVVEDTALAAAWAVENLRRPVVLMGHSAGGYNVLQTAFAPEIAAESGLDVCASVAGVVALAAPTGSYELKEEPYISVFPDRFRGDDAPLNRAKADFTPSQTNYSVPPIFLVHGSEDTVVAPRNSTDLADLLPYRAEVRIYLDRDHIDVVRLLARLFEDDSSIKTDVLNFIRVHGRSKADSFCY